LDFQTGVVKYEYEEGVVHSGAFINDENPEMIEMLRPVVDVARRNKVRLTAKEDKTFETQSTCFRDETYRDPLARYVNDARGLGDAPTDTTTAKKSKTIRTPAGSYSLVIYPHLPYELQPECRKCYRNFKTDAELREHLAGMPTHRITFRKQ
jgi:hypothetical protein